MSFSIPHLTRVSLWSAAAVTVGICIVFGGVVALNQLSGQQETKTVTASYIVHLPQDRAMLKELSDRLMAQTDVQGDTRALAEIAPAAGEPLAGEKAADKAGPAVEIPAYRGPSGE